MIQTLMRAVGIPYMFRVGRYRIATQGHQIVGDLMWPGIAILGGRKFRFIRLSGRARPTDVPRKPSGWCYSCDGCHEDEC